MDMPKKKFSLFFWTMVICSIVALVLSFISIILSGIESNKNILNQGLVVFNGNVRIKGGILIDDLSIFREDVHISGLLSTSSLFSNTSFGPPGLVGPPGGNIFFISKI